MNSVGRSPLSIGFCNARKLKEEEEEEEEDEGEGDTLNTTWSGGWTETRGISTSLREREANGYLG